MNLIEVQQHFTEVVARNLCFFEETRGKDLNGLTPEDFENIKNAWKEKYRNDIVFHSKVKTIVCELMACLIDNDEK